MLPLRCDAVAGKIKGAESIAALRATAGTMFDAVELHGHPDGGFVVAPRFDCPPAGASDSLSACRRKASRTLHSAR
jgi:hypothetical protein